MSTENWLNRNAGKERADRYILSEKLTQSLESLAAKDTEIAELKAEIERLNKALEFAGYMESRAEALISAHEELNRMYGEDGREHDSDDVVDAELKAGDAMQGLRSSIYEFDKRIARAEVKP